MNIGLLLKWRWVAGKLFNTIDNQDTWVYGNLNCLIVLWDIRFYNNSRCFYYCKLLLDYDNEI